MPTMVPIQIKPRDAERLIMLLPDSSERVAKIKTLTGRRWHQQERYWTVPQTNEAVTHLLTLVARGPIEFLCWALRGPPTSDLKGLTDFT